MEVKQCRVDQWLTDFRQYHQVMYRRESDGKDVVPAEI